MRDAMKYWVVLFFALLTAAGSIKCGEQKFFDTKGTEFFLTFIPNDHISTSGVDSLSIYIAADKPTVGFIEYRDINKKVYTHQFTITDVSRIHVFTLKYTNYELVTSTQDEVVAPQYFRVVSDSDVTVYALTTATTSSDAFLVLPVDVLNMHYFVMSYNTWSSDPSEFAVLGTEDGTTVTIAPTAATAKNSTKVQTVTLNKGESYLVQASSGDLTGSEITSDKPVAVFAGHERAAIPYTLSTASRDCIVEQMPPVDTWGKNAFIIPFVAAKYETYTSNSDIYRIIAALDNTTVKINGTETVTLNKGKYLERKITGAVYVESDKPIMTAQYKKTSGASGSDTYGDPLLLIVPPKEQYMDKYRVINTQAYEYSGGVVSSFTNHYIAVVAPSTAYNTLTLDGSAVSASSFKAISGSDYYYATIEVKAGVHYLECKEPFGIFIYGYGERNSYGYIGGMAMQPFDTEPPAILGNTSCYKAEGVVTDTALYDSGLESVSIPADSSENVITKITKIDSKNYSYMATLISQYHDGYFRIAAVDSSGLKSDTTIDIPGFTVWIKGLDPDGPAPSYSFETRTGKEYNFDIIFNNYGKFDHTIKDIRFRNNVFTIKSGSFTDIASGEEKTITAAITPDTLGSYTDTLEITHECGNREAAYIKLTTQLDYNPPLIQVTPDPCGTVFSVIISDSLSTDFGLDSIIVNELVNCTLSNNSATEKSSSYGMAITDPYYDAIYDITVTDQFGWRVHVRDTIQGFTLSINGTGSTGILDFGSQLIGTIACDTFSIKNYGILPFVFNDIHVISNTQYSLPQTQFPLTINPGETKDLAVCFHPLSAGETPITDTLKIGFKCMAIVIPFSGTGDPIERQGESRCGLSISIVTTSVPAGFILEQNIPNPVVNYSTAIRFGIPSTENVEISIFNLNGIKIQTPVEGTYTGGIYQVAVDTRNFSNGVYFYELSTKNVKLTRMFVVNN